MKTASLILTAGVILLVARCRDQSIASYRVRREKPVPGAPHVETPPPATTPAPERPAGPALATASGPGLTWTAPAHWVGKPLSAMRKGSYTVPGDGAEADLSITAFPGAVGGELANLNRWRGQLQLPFGGEAGRDLAFHVHRQRAAAGFEQGGFRGGGGQHDIASIKRALLRALQLRRQLHPPGIVALVIAVFGDDALADHHIAHLQQRRQRPAQADGDYAGDVTVQGVQLPAQARRIAAARDRDDAGAVAGKV